MTNYPQTMTDAISAATTHFPDYLSEEDQAKYYEQVASASPPVKLVGVFDILKNVPADQITNDGRRVLCGAAQMIAVHSFFGKAQEAIGVLTSNVVLLEAAPEQDGAPGDGEEPPEFTE